MTKEADFSKSDEKMNFLPLEIYPKDNEIYFSRFLIQKEVKKFPFGSIEYLRYSKMLDLSGLNYTDMIPAGLKGVESIQIRHKNPQDFPRFIAPDFNGEIGYFNDEEWLEMPKEMVLQAKKDYIKYRHKVESFRQFERGLYPSGVLPTNMHFIEKNQQVYLDLSHTSIKERPFILGVSGVIMPSKTIAHHKGAQMTHQKQRIKE